MPAFIPALNTLQVRMQFVTKTGDQAENVFYVKKSAPWDLAHVNTMLGAFITWFGTGDGGGHTYRAYTELHTSLVEVSGRDFTTDNGISVATSTGLPIAGQDASGAVPPGLTFALTARTGLAGRSFRGRTFLVAIGVDFYTDETLGTIAPAYAANSVLAFDALITAVTAADAAATLVVASFYGGAPTIGGKSQPRATAVLTPVTAYGYHNLSQDFQRRRSPQHHRHH